MSATTNSVKLKYNGAQIGTTNSGNQNMWPVANPSTGATNQRTDVYGDPNNLWGATLTPTIVNDPSFGFEITVAYYNHSTSQTYSFYTNNFELTVYYTNPGTTVGPTLELQVTQVVQVSGYAVLPDQTCVNQMGTSIHTPVVNNHVGRVYANGVGTGVGATQNLTYSTTATNLLSQADQIGTFHNPDDSVAANQQVNCSAAGLIYFISADDWDIVFAFVHSITIGSPYPPGCPSGTCIVNVQDWCTNADHIGSLSTVAKVMLPPPAYWDSIQILTYVPIPGTWVRLAGGSIPSAVSDKLYCWDTR